VNLHNKRAAGAQAIAGRRAAVIAGLPRHLRVLAHYVERLSVSRDPERFAASKGEIATTLENLAAVIEIERREQALERAPKSQVVTSIDLHRADGLQP
jgi:hypothetical protein